jgi:hypothetical protein
MLGFGCGSNANFLNRLNAGSDILRWKVCREAVVSGRCRGKAGRVFAALFCLCAMAARAADPAVSVAAPSGWISPLPFQRLTRPEDTNSGLTSHLLLRDLQINAQARETFQHEARQLLTLEGVQSGSRLSIDFDPSRQSLFLHWARIWRGSNAFNELDLGKIKVIQPERDVDRFLFTGEKTALLLLEDVRVGDIVDFAWTLRGENAGGGAKTSGAVLARKYEPVERLSTRLLWPTNRHLYLKNHGTDTKPAAARKGDLIEYTWDYKKVPGLRREAPLPAGYDPLPWVQWSEFQKWTDVNQWALPIFTNALPLSAELTRQIALWRRLPAMEERVLAVLQFMQDEVRYQGIETGAASYTPADPSLVFARRFGDCKDKTLLCVTILRALGIEANPVLVSTDLHQAIQDWQPTPAVFDHAIVQVSVDNQSYWLDPTAGFERGPLAARSWPNYGFGLVIRPKTTGLTAIPESPVQPRTTVLEYVLVRDVRQPADLKVVTLAEGADAVALRRRFASAEHSAIGMEDLNAFAALYPGIVASMPLEYADDAKANRVVVTEYYQIPNMWNLVPTAPGFVCRFFSYNIDRAARKPLVSARTMPLGLTYPEHEVFRAEITLPASIPVEPGTWAVNHPAFHFHKAVTPTPAGVLVEEEFDSLAESAPVEAVPDYLRQLDLVSPLLDYALYAL